ncbi:murein DD-endopeptidase MepM/ murein hydrolase activator NlpD [Sphaerotilus hippei]|uniref:Murein DD-endopeptidase MepM/ murein hydrolase activator NlpD n=1 Tax=Sphaerotilus hippei TaxID=744406 RepID=A0A318GYQ5_9BURK|nr:peptidoglycan DD-metalloendopeptidase family protein [Sphaerotilus hippei]PXW95262.1 murein DD-endopeptidase MepM/ murein hydrolase activator NlpD [Sphaerotilus hippei]
MTPLRTAVPAGRLLVLAGVCLWLAGCASGVKPRAPVEDRSVPVRAGASSTPSDPNRLPPGSENAGKPGYYMVKPGDTLIRIGLETGQNWKDLQRWNTLDNADRIEVGQVLRVVPPGLDPTSSASRPIGAARLPEPRPAPLPASGAAPAAPVASAPAPTPTPAPAAPAAAPDDDGINWMWPTGGAVLAAFDDARNKGVALAGKEGDPVLATADGRVVYAGAGLRGYGNLVIIKHNEVYLSAYAHNRALLVKDEQVVRRGQKIAEMGSTDAERVQLHFEIRRRGKPVDPMRLLPAR